MTQPQLVLVGVDGSPTSDSALGWALDVAGRIGAEVEALRAWQWDFGSLGVVVPDAPVEVAVATKHALQTQLEKALADRPSGSPTVTARARTAEGDPAAALLAEARRASLLVIGRHGQARWLQRLTGPMLGSVAGQCLNRSTVPVVVIPPDAAPLPPARIVVGVDGSPSSERALRWAVQHGKDVGAPVLAVLTWQLTSLPAPTTARADWSVPPLEDWEEVGRVLLEETVDRALGVEADSVGRQLLHRPAAAGLLDTVQDRDLLVLGDRGRGGFTRLLLGSVSRQCVEHAPCPVVVVPPTERATGG